jgi:hypothetical protein
MKIYSKILKAKKSFPSIKKESANPYFKSKYADLQTILEAVEGPLLDNGVLIVSQINENTVETALIDSENGERVSSYYDLTPGLNAQGRGSEITYARRYQLQCLLNLVAEDDDGNQASQKPDPKFNGKEKLDKMQTALNQDPNSKEKLLKHWMGYKDEFSKNGQMETFKKGVQLLTGETNEV